MQRRIRIGMAACMAVAALCWAGCAALNDTLSKQLLDYATVDAGATVKAASSSGSRSAESLINGVKDASKWSDGEGWEYTWERGENERRGRNRNQGGAVQTAIDRGSPWIHIRLKEPQRINRIVIHETDAPDVPAVGIENAFLQVRDMNDELRPWKTVGMVKSGWGYVPGRKAFQMKPVSKFLFNTVKTDQVRIVINTMMDKKRGESAQTLDRRVRLSVVMTVRLMEIEVTGSEADISDSAASIEASSDSKTKSAMKEPM